MSNAVSKAVTDAVVFIIDFWGCEFCDSPGARHTPATPDYEERGCLKAPNARREYPSGSHFAERSGEGGGQLCVGPYDAAVAAKSGTGSGTKDVHRSAARLDIAEL